MKRLTDIFFLTICIFQLSAKDNVSSYIVSDNIVTQHENNTKAVK